MRSFFGFLLLGAACVSQFALAAPGPAAPFTFGKDDLKLLDDSAAIDRQLEQRGLVYHDDRLEKYLSDLVKPILPAVTPDRVEWRFRILREPFIGTMALPNGSVYVNSGLLALLENDDQLAGVLAREITHVSNRDYYLFQRQYRERTMAANVARLSSQVFQPGAYMAIFLAARYVSPFVMGVTLSGLGRQLERNADENAATLLKTTGRNPAQLARVFELLQERLEPEPLNEISRNRRGFMDRIRNLEAVAGTTVSVQPIDSAYVVRMHAVICQNIHLDLESRHFRTAAARAKRLIDGEPRVAETWYWMGESYRSLGPRAAEPSAKQQKDWERNEAYYDQLKRTEQEEYNALAATAEGKAALDSNRARASESYEKALALDAAFARAHIGLGMLREQQNRERDAVAEYRKYLEQASAADEDRMRIARRVEALEHRNP